MTTIGSSAPSLMYTQAAVVPFTPSRKRLVPAATLMGTPIRRLSVGTLAQPAPMPNTPPTSPTRTNSRNPCHVRWIVHEISRPSVGS